MQRVAFCFSLLALCRVETVITSKNYRENIRCHRKAAGLSQEKVAEKADCLRTMTLTFNQRGLIELSGFGSGTKV